MSQDPNYLVNEIIFDDKVGILFLLEHRSHYKEYSEETKCCDN